MPQRRRPSRPATSHPAAYAASSLGRRGTLSIAEPSSASASATRRTVVHVGLTWTRSIRASVATLRPAACASDSWPTFLASRSERTALRITGLQIDASSRSSPTSRSTSPSPATITAAGASTCWSSATAPANPRSDSNQRKLLRYDALLGGLAHAGRALPHARALADRGRGLRRRADRPPLGTAADELLTGRVSRLADADAEAAFHARQRIFFATELDLHCGRLQGHRVPRHPPDLRCRLEGTRAGRRPAIEQVASSRSATCGEPPMPHVERSSPDRPEDARARTAWRR